MYFGNRWQRRDVEDVYLPGDRELYAPVVLRSQQWPALRPAPSADDLIQLLEEMIARYEQND